MGLYSKLWAIIMTKAKIVFTFQILKNKYQINMICALVIPKFLKTLQL